MHWKKHKQIKWLIHITTTQEVVISLIKLDLYTTYTLVASHYVLVSLLHLHGNLRLYTMRDDVHSYKTRNKSIIDTMLSTLKYQDCFPVLALKLYKQIVYHAKLLDRNQL